MSTTIEPEPTPPAKARISDVLSSLPSFGLSALYLYTWIQPTAIDKKMVSSLMLVMGIEFVNVHSSAVMENVIISEGPRGQRARLIAGLGLFYTLFVAGFCLSFGEWWPLVAFWGLTANRLLGVLFGNRPTGEEKARMQISWAMSVFFYVIGAGLTAFIPVPAFGITEHVVGLQELTGDGLWEVEPQTAIAFGFLYFAAMGFSELYTHKWIPGQMNIVQKVRRKRALRAKPE